MRNDRGVALVIVLLVMVSLSALAMSLALLSSTESRVTATYRDGLEVLYGAEAALERVLPDLAAERDVNAVLTGVTMSTFTDGPPGSRQLPDATFMDLHSLTNTLSCGRVAACQDADLDALSEDRPWGRNNPRWRLYGYGLLPGASRIYAVVWVADDPSETDADPQIDGGEPGGQANPGRGRLSLTAHGYGPAGTRRVVEATVATDGGAIHMISWREVR
jgi:hypothetical protein